MSWKRALAGFLLFCVLTGLTGCAAQNSILFRPVDDLIRPPRPQGADTAALLNAFRSGRPKESPSFLLQPVLTGDYQGSSLLFHDLDGDGNPEGIVLFQEGSSTLSEHPMGQLSVFSKEKDGGWRLRQTLPGSGSDVLSVRFVDLNKSGVQELLICWRQAAGRTLFALYGRAPGQPLEDTQRIANYYYSQLDCLDVDGDGQLEIFYVWLDDTQQPVQAIARALRLVTREAATKKAVPQPGVDILGEVRLNASVAEYTSLHPCQLPNGAHCFLLDADKGAGGMITEILLWDAENSQLTNLFFDPEQQTNTATWRKKAIPVRDIDGDSLPEIPIQSQLPGSGALVKSQLQEPVYLTRWCRLTDDLTLAPLADYDCRLYFNATQWVRLPQALAERITAVAETQAKPGEVVIHCYAWDGQTAGEELFWIKTGPADGNVQNTGQANRLMLQFSRTDAGLKQNLDLRFLAVFEEDGT
ncbi:MAG: VCBS repeat-containing protein [Oscillospiraceae bacterium]|jgi:hypothetical protein|nr:VCBS repeat-containing protein [Oscillospiraceae bacterium]